MQNSHMTFLSSKRDSCPPCQLWFLFNCLPVIGFYIIFYSLYLLLMANIYRSNSAIIRSGTSDFHVLESTLQECWEWIGGETREGDKSGCCGKMPRERG